jgi:hypothetical protein
VKHSISPERKTAYYAGMALTGVGLLLFLSVFISGAMNFGNFDNFQGQVRSSMFRAIGGMVLIVVGQVIRGIGARGLSGSGIVLDPEQARDDLKPYSNMAGGMLNDALEASNLSDHLGHKDERVVMIKCSACGKLNEEDSKFCQECGNSFAN